ncbi:glycosyltransferase [Sphingomonas flavescens]|uniref:glycosyltransferase n=1 Tax=Sphingomonas flavescens TaxID=3132797 RepID=UPI002804386E|nr:glycosyltransferase [Sphingomonas limnosediminicola]
MRLAYLCNVYPAISHSFVRREIEGLEAAGHEVWRFSLRPHGTLKDSKDLREAEITEAALSNKFDVLLSAVRLIVTRPILSLRSLNTAYCLSSSGLKQKARHLAYWAEAAWLLRRMSKYDIEHLHAHFGTNPAAVATIAQAWGGPPFSFTVHGPDEFDAPVGLSLTEKIRRAKFVAAISSFGSAQLKRWADLADWPKIKIVRCGLDASFLVRQPLPLPDDTKSFVCVARLSAQKGLPLLISACERLQRDGKSFSLTLIGDGELREQIDSEIKNRGLEQTIKLAGSCSSQEIQEALQSARAFVLPSFAEGLPVVIMEALALARPVIATSIAGIPELVDQTCGWVIPAGSEEALVNAMKSALETSTDDLFSMGQIGRARVLAMHDASRNAQLIAENAQ